MVGYDPKAYSLLARPLVYPAVDYCTVLTSCLLHFLCLFALYCGCGGCFALLLQLKFTVWNNITLCGGRCKPFRVARLVYVVAER